MTYDVAGGFLSIDENGVTCWPNPRRPLQPEAVDMPARILEVIGICVAVLLVLLVPVFVRNRLLMIGGGTIRLQVRVNTMVPGGDGRPASAVSPETSCGFHRMFSFAVRPTAVLNRRSLAVDRRRLPEGPERLNMPGN
jgi:hypothetical protein